MTLCQAGRVLISIPWKSSTIQSSPTSSFALWWTAPTFITGSEGSRMSKVHPYVNMQRVCIRSTVKRNSVLRKTLSGYRGLSCQCWQSLLERQAQDSVHVNMLRRLIEACVQTMGKPGSNWSVLSRVNYLLQAFRQDERRGERAVEKIQVRFAYKKEREWRDDTAWTVWPVGGRQWLTVIGSDLCTLMSSEPSNFLMYSCIGRW